VTVLLADALVWLVLGVELVAEPCDAVPRGASETVDDDDDEDDDSMEAGVYTPPEREPRRTTTTATEIPRTARMETRMTNQWRRQKEVA
jgi:hypothetical protein